MNVVTETELHLSRDIITASYHPTAQLPIINHPIFKPHISTEMIAAGRDSAACRNQRPTLEGGHLLCRPICGESNIITGSVRREVLLSSSAVSGIICPKNSYQHPCYPCYLLKKKTKKLVCLCFLSPVDTISLPLIPLSFGDSTHALPSSQRR